MTEIAVLYSNLCINRVSWEEKENLQRDDVLAISIIHPKQRNRFQSSILHDYYQLTWTDVDCCLTGHDGDYGFWKFDNPNLHPDWRFPFILPKNSIEFEGVYVNKEDWQKALVIFGDPDGGMF